MEHCYCDIVGCDILALWHVAPGVIGCGILSHIVDWETLLLWHVTSDSVTIFAMKHWYYDIVGHVTLLLILWCDIWYCESICCETLALWHFVAWHCYCDYISCGLWHCYCDSMWHQYCDNIGINTLLLWHHWLYHVEHWHCDSIATIHCFVTALAVVLGPLTQLLYWMWYCYCDSTDCDAANVTVLAVEYDTWYCDSIDSCVALWYHDSIASVTRLLWQYWLWRVVAQWCCDSIDNVTLLLWHYWLCHDTLPDWLVCSKVIQWPLPLWHRYTVVTLLAMVLGTLLLWQYWQWHCYCDSIGCGV